jgi:hypothetical protein
MKEPRSPRREDCPPGSHTMTCESGQAIPATASDRRSRHSRGRVSPNGRPPKWRPAVAGLSIGRQSRPSRRSSPNNPAPRHNRDPERPERPPLEARVVLREPRRSPAPAQHPEPAEVVANPPSAPPEPLPRRCWGEAGPAADRPAGRRKPVERDTPAHIPLGAPRNPWPVPRHPRAPGPRSIS